MITKESEHIKVKGHVGTWHVIDEGWYVLTPDTADGPRTILAHCFLLEHDEYGDEAASVIIDQDGKLLLDDVYNGFDDLEEAGWSNALFAAYCRVDRDCPEDAARLAVNQQDAQLKEYAKVHNAKIAIAYQDIGFQGDDMERPGLVRMMEAAGRQFDAVLVVNLSRLSRTPRVWPFPIVSLNPVEQEAQL